MAYRRVEVNKKGKTLMPEGRHVLMVGDRKTDERYLLVDERVMTEAEEDRACELIGQEIYDNILRRILIEEGMPPNYPPIKDIFPELSDPDYKPVPSIQFPKPEIKTGTGTGEEDNNESDN